MKLRRIGVPSAFGGRICSQVSACSEIIAPDLLYSETGLHLMLYSVGCEGVGVARLCVVFFLQCSQDSNWEFSGNKTINNLSNNCQLIFS